MKILLIAMPTTLETKVVPLEEAGHTVLLLNGINDSERTLNLVHDVEAEDYILEKIVTFEPDMVINAITSIVLPLSDSYTYVGNTALSARLETHKWETRTKAGELGWSLPTLLEECKMNAISDYDDTVYVKPKNDIPRFTQIYKIPTSLERTTHDITESASTVWNQIATAEGFDNTDCYVEASVDYSVEAWCFFTISNGSYSIIRTLGCTGYGNDKLPTSNGDWTSEDITLLDLTESQDAAFRSKCNTWLDYAVTLGGNYEGTLGGAITDDNTVVWFEQNSRPGTYNNGMLPGTIQDWIDGLTTDSTKSINQISAATIRSAKGYG